MEGQETIKIIAEEVTTFLDFQEWVNKATSRIGGFRKEQKIICVDIKGNTLTIGEDFMYLGVGNPYPFKVGDEYAYVLRIPLLFYKFTN